MAICEQCCSCKIENENIKVTHVIFDLDGTILDTQKHYSRAIQETVEHYGYEFDTNLTPKLIGRTTQNVVEITMNHIGINLPKEEFIAKYREYAQALVINSELLPGVKKVITHFYNHKIPMAIASSSINKSFQKKVEKHQDIIKMFNHYVLSDDPEVKHGKPHPDIFLVTCKRFPLKPSPEECLVFEDAITGLDAAKAAHMKCVIIPDKNLILTKNTNADLIIKSLEDFKPELFQFPPY